MKICQLEKQTLSSVFFKVCFRVADVLAVTRSQAPTTEEMKGDENKNVVILEVVSSSVFTTVRD